MAPLPRLAGARPPPSRRRQAQAPSCWRANTRPDASAALAPVPRLRAAVVAGGHTTSGQLTTGHSTFGQTTFAQLSTGHSFYTSVPGHALGAAGSAGSAQAPLPQGVVH